MLRRTTIGSSVRFKSRFGVVAALACAVALMSVAAVALAKTRHSASKTVTLPAKSTKTIDVRYPNALKFKNAKYACSFKVVNTVDPKKVKILFHGSALGGTVCRVKARNSVQRPSIDATAHVKVTATTTY
jgi:hypothetical protein